MDIDTYFPFECFRTAIRKRGDLGNFAAAFFKQLQDNDSSRNEFKKLTSSSLSNEQLRHCIDVLTNLSFYVNEFRKGSIIDYVICDPFYDNLVRHVRFLYKSRSNHVVLNSDFPKLVNFYEGILIYLPDRDVVYQKLFALFQMTFDCMKLLGKCDLDSFAKLKELIQIIIELSEPTKKCDHSYKYVSLYPSSVNLFQKLKFVENLVEGPYDHSEKYLSTHFYLLRENFFQEIRDDFQVFKKNQIGINVESNYNIFRNVKTNSSCFASMRFKLCHIITFAEDDVARLKKLDWTKCKKFMIGSLMFFTRNNFTTFFIGTVEQNMCELTKGRIIKIEVSIIGNPFQLQVGELYDMLEPSAFFEPYYQSLKIMQTMNPYNFPLAEDIISVSKDICPSLLLKTPDSLPFYYNGSDLNKPQMDALHACLNEKFTLVQGPPGTGKTYLTHKILTILSEDTSDKRPVLVVCVRNRSLDIILEPLAQSGIKVLRFGRTENEYLKDFSYYEYARGWSRKSLKKTNSWMFIKKKLDIFRSRLMVKKRYNEKEMASELIHHYNKASEALRRCLDYDDSFQILSNNVQIVGATTTGAAKRNKTLSQMNIKAVIIEEAAEALESFVVTSLPDSCDHLILIGDHKQLRPVTKLPRKSNLQISLFERMIQNQKHYHTLTVQYRMRPEIAGLISLLFYDELSNHPSIYKYPDVRGISYNIFFLAHSASEEFKPELLSFTNPHEGLLALSFANYMVKQGYSPRNITILAAYSAQLYFLFKESRVYPNLSGMEIQTIDNYQGEENDIVILSFVRSKGKTIGFLTEETRVNVALSRARIGCYMFGNMNCLSKHSEMWSKIKQYLEKKTSIGPKLPLKCKTHQNYTLVSSPEELNILKYGGCTLKCGLKLKCGHFCELPCHPDLILHTQKLCKCKKKCKSQMKNV